MAANPSHADATKSLIGLIGFYDNLHETKPVSNYPETIIALAVTFLVRRWPFFRLPMKASPPARLGLFMNRTLTMATGNHVGMRLLSHLHTVTHHLRARVG